MIGSKVFALRFSPPLAIAAGFALPLAVFASKGMAPLFALTVLTAIVVHGPEGRLFSLLPMRFSATLAALLVLAAASALWSLTPQRSIEAVLPLAGLFFGFAYLSGLAGSFDDAARARARTALLIGAAVGLMLLLIEGAFGRPLLRTVMSMFGLVVSPETWALKPAATISVLLFWPVLVALRRITSRRGLLLAAPAAFFAAIALVASDASVLGLITGGTAFLVARRWNRIAGPVLGVLVAVFMAAAPLLPGLLPDPHISMRGIEYLPNSAVHRIVIWQTTAKHIRERPWLGHGFDTSRHFYPQRTAVTVQLAKPTIGQLDAVTGEPIPLHPHNMILQVWLELGAAGILALTAMVLTLILALARAPLERTDRAAGYGLCVAALTVAAVSYGAWQAWWLSALGLCGVAFVAVLARAPETS